jgi:putative glycerol-1-phosphate prenyltransferase
MNRVYDILNSKKKNIAVLIDPEKTNDFESLNPLISKVSSLNPAFIFVGGSTVDTDDFKKCIENIKGLTSIPLVIFPGDHNQIDESADGILFLSLLSGRNPDYLIGHQVQSAHLLKKMNIEVIPTAYLLVDGGKNSSVAYVSQTRPIPNDQNSIAVNTAVAGELLGFKCVFIDAGSGAKDPVPAEMIKEVKSNLDIPLIIGGGIKSIEELDTAFKAGADLIVIGNKIEEDTDFLLDLIQYYSKETTISE